MERSLLEEKKRLEKAWEQTVRGLGEVFQRDVSDRVREMVRKVRRIYEKRLNKILQSRLPFEEKRREARKLYDWYVKQLRHIRNWALEEKKRFIRLGRSEAELFNRKLRFLEEEASKFNKYYSAKHSSMVSPFEQAREMFKHAEEEIMRSNLPEAEKLRMLETIRHREALEMARLHEEYLHRTRTEPNKPVASIMLQRLEGFIHSIPHIPESRPESPSALEHNIKSLIESVSPPHILENFEKENQELMKNIVGRLHDNTLKSLLSETHREIENLLEQLKKNSIKPSTFFKVMMLHNRLRSMTSRLMHDVLEGKVDIGTAVLFRRYEKNLEKILKTVGEKFTHPYFVREQHGKPREESHTYRKESKTGEEAGRKAPPWVATVKSILEGLKSGSLTIPASIILDDRTIPWKIRFYIAELFKLYKAGKISQNTLVSRLEELISKYSNVTV